MEVILLDTNIFLNVKNKEQQFYEFSKKLLDSVDDGKFRAILSVISVAEICAGYHEAGEEREKDDFMAHIQSSPNFKVVNLDPSLADYSGKIRAQTKLRLPDAILVATALIQKARTIATHDERLKNASKLIKIASARELLKSLQT